MIFRRLFSAFVILLCTASCKKYLDKKSDSSLIVPQTLEDAQGLLDLSTIMNRATPALGETSATDYFLLTSDYDVLGTFEKNFYTWTPGEYNYVNDWRYSYLAVYYSNLSLEIIDKVPVTTQNQLQWNNVKGSALFFRAYYFLNLSWIFSKAFDDGTANNDLGIALRLGSDFNVPSVRATVRQSYDRVILDTKTAIPLLPDYPQHVLRPSKAAAYGLLARAYLSMRKYDSAFKYSDLCLRLKNELMNYNVQGGDVIDITAPVTFKRYNAETIFFSQINLQTLAHPDLGKIDTVLYAMYDSNDLRKKAFFTPDPGSRYQKFKGNYTQAKDFFFTGIATDEMYLTRAECYARLNNKDSALADLNKLLRNRWQTGTFADITATDAQDALNKILVERRKELLMRGLRWIDIKRLNKEPGPGIFLNRVMHGQTYTLQPNAGYYALPLPTDIINLTGMPQNPY